MVAAGPGDVAGHHRVVLDGGAEVILAEETADLRGEVNHEVRLLLLDHANDRAGIAEVALVAVDTDNFVVLTELGTKVLADETGCAGHEDSQGGLPPRR